MPGSRTKKKQEETGEEPEEGREEGLAGIKDVVGCVAKATPGESIKLLCQVGKRSVDSLGSISHG